MGWPRDDSLVKGTDIEELMSMRRRKLLDSAPEASLFEANLRETGGRFNRVARRSKRPALSREFTLNLPAFYLGVDCGTQGTKALVADSQGTVVGRGYAPHLLIQHPSGAREQEPQWWIDAMCVSIKQAVSPATSAHIRALGVSGQQHGLVVLDEAMRVIRPAKLWNDTETTPQNDELLRHFGGRESFQDRFGIVPMTGYTVSKLLWLKQREPENFARVRHILLPHEYLNWWLTGELCAEYGDASGTGYFDNRTRKWVPKILDYIDGGSGHLLRALPQLLPASATIGHLKAEVAEELGLPASCLVSTGGGDNMMGALGTGNVTEGVVTLSLGTSSTVYSFHGAPLLEAPAGVAPFCSSSDGWLPLVCTMNATNIVTQLLNVLGQQVEDIEAALLSTTPGADGLTFIPFLNGERTPDLPSAQGSLVGISASNFTKSNLIRSAIEGVSFGIVSGLNLILSGSQLGRVILIGGGARSAQWRQLIADMVGAVVQVPVEEEAGCLGACIQAVFAEQSASGGGASLPEIANQWVKMDSERSAKADPEKWAAYQSAQRLYLERLSSLYDLPDQT